MVWLELTSDQTSAWRNADILRRHLQLELPALLPDRPTIGDPRPNSELVAVRAHSASRLNQLAKEWVSDQAAE
jgi:hypothetical protein